MPSFQFNKSMINNSIYTDNIDTNDSNYNLKNSCKLPTLRLNTDEATILADALKTQDKKNCLNWRFLYNDESDGLQWLLHENDCCIFMEQSY